MTEPVQKPVPTPSPDAQPFYDGAKQGQLMIQRCGRCGVTRFVARTHCAECGSAEFIWVRASGRATLISWAHVHQKYHPAFLAETPYPIATVELEEGPRMVSNLVQVGKTNLRAGLPLEVVFEDAGDWRIPKFRPA
jgi:uncharacterized OB-fold protein